jgi:glycosyltransferase involved in cell wall biosynthesis
VRSKRALFIVITDYPGGAERITFSLASELASRPGWTVEVMIICSRLPDSFSARALSPDVRVRFGPFRNWFLSFPLLPFRLLFGRYDLVFSTHIYTNALLSLLRRLGLIRTRLLVARESISVFDRVAGLKKRLFALLYRAYGGEDLLIAQTGYLAEHVTPWLPPISAARIQVVPNPVDTRAIEQAVLEPIEPELRARLDGRTNIVFCGRLVGFKRPAVAVEAFHLATGDDASAQLVFLGGGPLEADARRKAAEAGISDRVLFLGFRTNPYPVMAACQYGLVTSLREGFPNVVLEMMACGIRKAVITPCAGDLDQLTGVTVTQGFDVEEISEALRAALRSGEDCRDIYRRVAASRSVAAYVDEMLGAGLTD